MTSKFVVVFLVFAMLAGCSMACRQVGPHPVYYDSACSQGQSLGCNAGGQGQNCRFCWASGGTLLIRLCTVVLNCAFAV